MHTQEIFLAWQQSVGSIPCTPLGVTIGHAYWQQISGQSLPLERFVKEL